MDKWWKLPSQCCQRCRGTYCRAVKCVESARGGVAGRERDEKTPNAFPAPSALIAGQSLRREALRCAAVSEGRSRGGPSVRPTDPNNRLIILHWGGRDPSNRRATMCVCTQILHYNNNNNNNATNALEKHGWHSAGEILRQLVSQMMIINSDDEEDNDNKNDKSRRGSASL